MFYIVKYDSDIEGTYFVEYNTLSEAESDAEERAYYYTLNFGSDSWFGYVIMRCEVV